MVKLKTAKTDASVYDFIKSIPEDLKRKEVESILAIMRSITQKQPAMWGKSIVGFGDRHLKYASGRELDWFEVGFSPRKQNLVIYIMSGLDDKKFLLQKLGKHKTGKCCLYINKLADIDMSVLKEIIKLS